MNPEQSYFHVIHIIRTVICGGWELLLTGGEHPPRTGSSSEESPKICAAAGNLPEN